LAARQIFGDEEAATLMEYLPPVGWADVATKHDLAQLETRLDARIDGLRAELKADMTTLRAELHDAMREQTTRLVTWLISAFLTSVSISGALRFTN
jgi:hypothetical protein